MPSNFLRGVEGLNAVQQVAMEVGPKVLELHPVLEQLEIPRAPMPSRSPPDPGILEVRAVEECTGDKY